MDKNHYKFNLNPSPPSDEQIARHMDFDALVEKFESSKSRKGGVRVLYWLAPLAAAAAILGWVLLPGLFQSNGYANQEIAYFASKPFVNPPLPELQAEFVSQKFDAFQGGVIEYDNGSKVIIPKAAFVDDQGTVIGGEVEIRFREYKDYIDFFLSGIPMHYDSAGTRYQLESAGMMELYAEQNGKRLNVAPGKNIQVELSGEVLVSSEQPNLLPDFNIYRLDTDERNWVFQGKDQLTWADKLGKAKDSAVDAQRKYDRAAADMELDRKNDLQILVNSLPSPVKPEQPERAKEDDFIFDFSFNDFDDPSLVGLREKYEGSLWKVSENNLDFNSELAGNIQWESMDLKRINDQDFQLTLFSGGNSIIVLVSPVLTGETYRKALADYEEAIKQYEIRQSSWAEDFQEKLASLNRKFDALLLAAKNEKEDAISKNETDIKHQLRRKVINKFSADRLGIWNCDIPTKPYDRKVSGTFMDEEERVLDQYAGYLVDKNQNTISRFYATNGAPVEFNQESVSLMWIVSDDGEIAIFKPQDFRKIEKSEGSHNFVMNKIEKDIKTEQDLRKVLEF